jgi:hypothetical protein
LELSKPKFPTATTSTNTNFTCEQTKEINRELALQAEAAKQANHQRTMDILKFQIKTKTERKINMYIRNIYI